jgi:hypothetical protein
MYPHPDGDAPVYPHVSLFPPSWMGVGGGGTAGTQTTSGANGTTSWPAASLRVVHRWHPSRLLVGEPVADSAGHVAHPLLAPRTRLKVWAARWDRCRREGPGLPPPSPRTQYACRQSRARLYRGRDIGASGRDTAATCSVRTCVLRLYPLRNCYYVPAAIRQHGQVPGRWSPADHGSRGTLRRSPRTSGHPQR